MSDVGTKENPKQIEYSVGQGTSEIELTIAFGYAQVGGSIILDGPGKGDEAAKDFDLGTPSEIRGKTSKIRQGILDVSRAHDKYSIMYSFKGGVGPDPDDIEGKFEDGKRFRFYYTNINYV